MATVLPWGEQITVLMELGFPVDPFTLDSAELGLLDEGYLDGTLLGDDVSEYCRQITINRGRPDQLQNFNAGTCSITLNNFDRRFDPTNQDSPYWNPTTGKSGVTPRRKVTVFSGGVELFTGRITDIDISYEPNQPTASIDNSVVTITASDDFVLLANTYIADVITPSSQLSGARVTSILDLPEVNYPATRNIDDGVATLGGGATFEIAANTNVLTYLQDVATAEQGYFFIAANGDLTFTDRVAASFASPSATFSDTNSDLPYTALSVLYGQEFLYNKVVASVIDGTDQIANDVISQEDYGISTLNLSGLLLEDDDAAATLAADLLDKYKEPQYRFDRLQTLYNGLDGTDQETITSLELADVVSITRTYPTGSPASVTERYSIEALRHVITPSDHRVEIQLAVADLVYPFILSGYPLTTRTNLLPDPNFENASIATYWQAIRITESRSTDYAYSGTYSMKGVIDTASAGQYFQVLQTAGAMIDVSAGETYTFSAYIYLPASNTDDSTWRAELYYWNGTSYTGSNGGTTVTVTRGNWTRLTTTATVPAGYYKALPRIAKTGTALAVGQIAYVDAWVLETGSTLLPYFDGSNADPYTGYVLNSQSWSGQANASSSTATWYQGATRTNLAQNPNYETGTAYWSADSGNTITRITTDSYSGTASLKCEVTSATGVLSIYQPSGSRVPMTAGVTNTMSVYVKVPTGEPSVTVTPIMRYHTAVTGGSFISDTTGSAVVVTSAMGWTRISVTGTSPATTGAINMRTSTGTMSLGDVLLYDAWVLETGSTLLPYFDGTYADTYTGYTLTSQNWNGTADASTSTATWGLDSAFSLGSPMDSDYALT